MIRLPECPICGRTAPPASDANASYSPFCSRRCKEVDLVRWCEGRYAIVESLAADDDEMIESEISDLDAE